ncbi:MAG: 1-(5-phosphoribosyl)-5-[(5-phosphoribosylamino)methylideneamino]imidazole-4-carboxamide isomerase, partial [Candidatus Omnitrophica bacterium]|nr:1-(5-phosphoribosyl)-5-[(5-phosphoribosylamino)methylideneamino]imidazole-4-carboxamide isomerase [Candidatus Omnitrophota bacterium]
MLIIPAIDIKDGFVVRFTQGKFQKKMYSKDPIKTARHWQRQGAQLLHIVDLDGASTGIPKNLGIIKMLIKSLNVPIQIGGGIRSLDTIEGLVKEGVFRVVLGTRAIEDIKFLKQAFDKFKQKIIVSLDVRDGILATRGWQTTYKKIDIQEFCQILKDIGFTEIIYTDISKDGTLRGPNIKVIKSLLKNTGLKLIASGGISSLEDIRKLKML